MRIQQTIVAWEWTNKGTKETNEMMWIHEFQSSNEKPFWAYRSAIGDEILHSYMGILLDYSKPLLHKNPYETNSIMESKRFFLLA